VIGPDGKLFKLYRGNEWKPAEIVSDLIEGLKSVEPQNKAKTDGSASSK